MQFRFFCFKILFFALIICFGLTHNISSQQRINYNEIIEKGERFLFRNTGGSFESYMVVTFNNTSILIVFYRADTVHNIINGIWFMQPFTGSFTVPAFASPSEVDTHIRHVTRDIYELRWGRNVKNVTKIKAPEGFWSNAFLDLEL